MPRRAHFEEAFFSLLLRTGGKVTESAELAGVTKQAIYRRRDVDPVFRERLVSALQSVQLNNRDAAERRYARGAPDRA